MTAAVLGIGAITLSSCGGNGGGSKLKKNEFLGTLPSLYEAYNTQKADAEARLETESNKLMAGGEKNYEKVQKMFDEAAEKQKTRDAEFKQAVAAELATLVGRQVPVAFSTSLEPWFDASAKIGDVRGEPRLMVTVTAKSDMTIPSMRGYDYNIYLRMKGADGATLENSKTALIPVTLLNRAQTITAGQVLLDAHNALGFNLNSNTADAVGFSGIEFITKQEYEK